MEKPASEGQFAEGQPPREPAETIASAAPPSSGAAPGAPTYAWWLVLGLVGLDYFSTLAYLPSIAVADAGNSAPFAALGVVVLTLFAALPVYLYVAGRSPHGHGATGLLEKYVRGWTGKLLILCLLAFIATDFLVTRTLSTADAARHLIYNPHVQSGLDWLLRRKDITHAALPDVLQGSATDQFFDWWNGQLIVTVLLLVLGFGLYAFLLRGFSRPFLYLSLLVVLFFLIVNGVVIGSGLVYLYRHPNITTEWMNLVRFAGRDAPVEKLLFDLFMSLLLFPQVALGLGGLELSLASAPLLRGRPSDAPARPRGRIRSMRLVLAAAAVIMSVFLAGSVFVTTLLIPPSDLREPQPFQVELPSEDEDEPPNMVADENGNLIEVQKTVIKTVIVEGPARERALAYIAHGGSLAYISHAGARTSLEKVDGQEVNAWFGPTFGSLYDLSAVLILCLAGASLTISLRDLVPAYLMRYGMQMRWAHRVGVILHLFNLIMLIVIVIFRASVAHQQSTYATSVLVLLFSAALAVVIDLTARLHRSAWVYLAIPPFAIIVVVFLSLAGLIIWYKPGSLVIAMLLLAVLFISAGISRWARSTELRFEGFVFADEESGIRWEQIRRLEFQVLVPHLADGRTLAEKEAEIRARHRLAPDVPIIFIESKLGDPSDFQQQPLMRIVKEDGREVIRVSDCASIAHVLAAIALEFREVGRPPEIHFAWSEESPLTSNINFLLFGEGNIPWLVRALIHRAEPEPARQPRVVIG
ncbi:MAG: amino acid transporter [Gemmataceae bacterium]